MLRVATFAIVAFLVTFVGATWWALESGDVAMIETTPPSGDVRATRVWYAESDGDRWLEAGTPDNPWYRDALRNPEVVLIVNGVATRHRAEPVAGAEAHQRIRALLGKKYGLRDSWISMIFDTSKSVAVRLAPIETRVPE
jgi:hypothetical protein